MQREFFITNWYFLFITVGLFCCVVAKVVQPKKFINLIQIPFNNQYFIKAKDQSLFEGSSVLLLLNYLLMLGMLIYFSFLYFFDDFTYSTVQLIVLFFALLIFHILKMFFEIFLSWIFDIKSIIKVYIFHKSAFLKQIGIMLIPLLLLLIFGGFNQKIMIPSIIVIFCLIKLISFLIVLRKNQNHIISHFFYFLLYLCALEIAPYILIYKALFFVNF